MADLALLESLVPGQVSPGVQRARLLASALRPQAPEDALAVESRSSQGEADVLSGLGAALSGYGDRAIDQMAGGYARSGSELAGRAQEGRKFSLMQALEAQREARRRKEHLSDVASERAWQEQRDKLLRENRLDEARILAQQKKEEKKAETTQKDTKELSEDLDKFGAPAFYQKAREVDSIINNPEYKDDLPGVGRIAGKLPDFLVGDDGVKLRQSAGQMLAEYRKGITGSGMSEGEKQEYAQITGLMNSGDEKAYRLGYEQLRRAMDARVSARAAGTPDAAEEYSRRQPWMREALQRNGGASPAPVQTGRQVVTDKSGKVLGYINADGSEEWVK